MGATETIDWIHFSTTAEAVLQLKEKGYQVFALEQAEGSISLDSFRARNHFPLAIVLGNEVEGVDAEVLKLCDGCIEIPQFGMKHSLNVSVAAGIVLWEMVRNG